MASSKKLLQRGKKAKKNDSFRSCYTQEKKFAYEKEGGQQKEEIEEASLIITK